MAERYKANTRNKNLLGLLTRLSVQDAGEAPWSSPDDADPQVVQDNGQWVIRLETRAVNVE